MTLRMHVRNQSDCCKRDAAELCCEQHCSTMPSCAHAFANVQPDSLHFQQSAICGQQVVAISQCRIPQRAAIQTMDGTSNFLSARTRHQAVHLHVAACAAASPHVKPHRHVRHGSLSIFICIFCRSAALSDDFPLLHDHMTLHKPRLIWTRTVNTSPCCRQHQAAEARLIVTNTPLLLHRSGATRGERHCPSRRPLPHPCAGLAQPPPPDFRDFDDFSALDTVRLSDTSHRRPLPCACFKIYNFKF